MARYEYFSNKCRINPRPTTRPQRPRQERPLPYYRCWVCGSVWLMKDWRDGRCPLGCVDAVNGYSTHELIRRTDLAA